MLSHFDDRLQDGLAFTDGLKLAVIECIHTRDPSQSRHAFEQADGSNGYCTPFALPSISVLGFNCE